jgi:aerobic-type carbon monoxide dehydrogenase small subunit (CoxS/CutS family)
MTRAIHLTVNGRAYTALVEPRTSLADCLREQLDLTGTHVGCEHGVCGACTVLLDGEPIRRCLMLAVQADGQRLTTIEGLAGAGDGRPGADVAEAAGGAGVRPLHPLQEAFRRRHGLQCGYCTPGILLAAHAFLREHPEPTATEIREMLAGHLCRCTGYQFIVEAIEEGARALRSPEPRITREGGAS